MLDAEGVAGWGGAAMLEGSAAVAEARQAQAGMGSAARPQPLAPREADARDVAATLAGSADAFDALVKRHEKDVAVRMWRFSRESRVRGELVQDVFVEAYLSLRSYRPDRPFLHWLRKIATRVGYRHWEDQERRRRQLRASAAPPAPALEGAAPESARAAALLHALLARLGLEDRLVLTLMYFDDCGIREVAERTGWIRAAVAMRAHRARRRLRRIIERENLSEELQWLR